MEIRTADLQNMDGEGAEAQNEKILTIALDVGEQILMCGGEVSRVEDTIQRICAGYGAGRTDVFAITSSIVVTMHRGGGCVTQTRRINGSETDFSRMEALNALSRRICSERPDTETVQQELKIISVGNRQGVFPGLSGYLLGSGSFAVFFGGSVRDGICAMLCGILIFFMDRRVRRIWDSRLLYAMLCSFLAGVCALIFDRMGLCRDVDKVMIGDIMLLIPGIALTNALRDLFMGDTISGLLRLLEALLQAAAIACGFALASYLGGVFA